MVLALIAAAGTACGTSENAGPGAPAPTTKVTTVTATTTAPAETPTSPSPSPLASTPAAAHGPGAVVQAYYDAINAHDYRTAWNLGGSRFQPDYATFVAAFAGTAHDRLHILGVSGSAVSVRIEAAQTSGAVRHYEGTYYVSGRVITGADVSEVTQPAPDDGSTVGFVHPGAFCSPVGAYGTTDKGTLMVCSLKSGDTQARWRHA